MVTTMGGSLSQMLVRVSIGTELVLGLRRGRSNVEPTTAYLLTYHEGKCAANCGFCTQARESTSDADMLSRVAWPPHPVGDVVRGLVAAAAEGAIRRVCIQTLIYSRMVGDVIGLVKILRERVGLPVSVSCHPLAEGEIRQLAEAGVEKIIIPVDAASDEIFERAKGKNVEGFYSRKRCFNTLEAALRYFGEGRVGSYLIVGLGETEREAVEAVQELKNLGVFSSLFAFTPIRGTLMENHPRPPPASYHKIQLAHHLITEGIGSFEDMSFDAAGSLTSYGVNPKTLDKLITSGIPFLTRGCPDCNRPYYNETTLGPIYNYPRQPTETETGEIRKMLEPYIKPAKQP